MELDGEVLGEQELAEIVGEVLGARHRGGMRRHGASIRLPPKPKWRTHQIAPGVNAPMVGKVPLPLRPDVNGGVFNTANPVINFTARPQKPFQPLRLLSTVVLTAPAVGFVQLNTIFVGTDLQQAQLGGFDVAFFAPTAFDVMLELTPAEPGIDIQLQCSFNGTISTGSAAVSLLFLGHYIQ